MSKEAAGVSPIPVDAYVRAEQIRLLYTQSPILLAGIVCLIVTTGWFLWDKADPTLLRIWLLANALLVLIRVVLVMMFRRHGQISGKARSWGIVFAVSAALSGLLWGSLALWALPPVSIEKVVYIVTILSAMASGSLTPLSAWAPAYHAFVVPALSLLVAGLLFVGGETFYLLAILEAVFLVTHLFFSATTARSIRETLWMRYENAALYQQARQAEREKTHFLAAASHDLRQPHQALGLFLEALERAGPGSERRAVLDHARQAFSALTGLLDQLLDISKIDSGALRAEVRALQLMPLLHRLALESMPQVDLKGLELRLRQTDAVVLADPRLLTRILSNLLYNAIRYTDSGGILLAVRRRSDRWRIDVWDTGRGIPEDQLDNVFREFTQLDNPERDREKGLGLGLSIVRRLAALMDAEISLHSRLGKGSCFSVTLPASTLGAVPLGTDDTSSATGPGPGKQTVGVIDDDRLARKGVEVLLETWGYGVLACSSQQECLERLERSGLQLDSLVVDYRLRGHSTGVAAVAAIRRQAGRDIPALIVTGDTAPERIEEIQAHGLPLLRKPVSPADLETFLAGASSSSATGSHAHERD